MPDNEFNIAKFRAIKQLILSQGPEGLKPETERAKPWEREAQISSPEGRKEYWLNVTEHAQAVAQVADVLAKLVKLPEGQHQQLVLAAWAHETGKREEILGTKQGKYPKRKTAEERTHQFLADQYGSEIAHIIRGTSVGVMEEYHRGELSGNNELLTRLLFFADEVVDGSKVTSWQERIAAWTDEDLKTKPVEAYGGQTQAQIESKFAVEVETQIRELAKLPSEIDLVPLLRTAIKAPRVLKPSENEPWVPVTSQPDVSKLVFLDSEDLNDMRKAKMVNTARLHPGQTLSPHEHINLSEIFVIIGGRGVITIKDMTWEITPGDMAVAWPYQLHSITNVSSDELTICTVGFAV